MVKKQYFLRKIGDFTRSRVGIPAYTAKKSLFYSKSISSPEGGNGLVLSWAGEMVWCLGWAGEMV